MVTDTGLWRLVVDLSGHRLQAWLRRTDDAAEPMHLLADTRWTDDDTLTNIENAVYDNPVVLDDFEADVIVTTPRFVCLPAALGADEELCRKAYSLVFGETAAQDIMTDCGEEYTFVYMLVPGLRSFLTRTLAGSRICCRASRLAEYWGAHAGDGRHLFADYREGTLDMALFADGRLQLAARRDCERPDDAAYFLLNALTLNGESPADAAISLSGEEEPAAALAEAARRFVRSIDQTELPAADDAPPAAIVCAYRQPTQNL